MAGGVSTINGFPALGFSGFDLAILIISSITIGVAVVIFVIGSITVRKRGRVFRNANLMIAIASILSLSLLVLLSIVQICLLRNKMLWYWCFASLRSKNYSDTFNNILCTDYGQPPERLLDTPLELVTATTRFLLTLLGDYIIAYRAAAMYPRRKNVFICAFLPWVLCVGCALAEVVLLFRWGPGLSNIFFDTAVAWLPFTFTGLSALTSFVASYLIVSRLWSYRYCLSSESRSSTSRKSETQRVFIITVESGCAYCAVQIFFFVYALVTAPHFKLGIPMPIQFVQCIVYTITGLYPVALYIIINVHHLSNSECTHIEMTSSASS